MQNAVGIIITGTALGFGILTPPHSAQSPTGETTRFEVASIKPSKMPVLAGSGFRVTEGRLRAVNTTVEDLVRFAYGLEHGDRESISGGPRWITSDRFEVEGKAEGRALAAGLQTMLKSLLADRFKLRVHEELKERDVYALAFARNDRRFGPGLTPTTAAESAHCASVEAEPPPEPEFLPDGTRRCAASFRGGMTLRGRPLGDLAEMLGELLGRPVIDRTGLDRRVDADLDTALNWDRLVGGGVTDTLGSNAVTFTALREQLGLKLEAARGAVRTVVIDSVERPTED